MLLTMGSLFDGIGGFPLGAFRNHIKTIWASEIEPFPIRVTQQRFPSMAHMGDITQLKGSELFPVDIICGGSPCQDCLWPEHVLDFPGRVPAYLWSRSASSKRCGRQNGKEGARVTVSAHVIYAGKTCRVPLAAERPNTRTSALYWKRSSEYGAPA